METSQDRYLNAVIKEYAAEVGGGFTNDFEARKSLWYAAVIVFESAEDPKPWLDMLRNLSVDVIKPGAIANAIRSAERRVASHV